MTTTMMMMMVVVVVPVVPVVMVQVATPLQRERPQQPSVLR